MTTEPNAETVDRVAKAINGPHDATHIGKEKLMELQEYGWKNYTDKNDRETLRIEARAAIAAMADREVTVQEAARVLHKELISRLPAVQAYNDPIISSLAEFYTVSGVVSCFAGDKL